MKHRIDLHIHTVLSPCGDWSMSPVAIAKMAKHMHLDLISITDHNSIYNIPACEKTCHVMGIEVVPGIEIQTKEEVHLLGYFESYEKISKFYDEYEKTLPYIALDPETQDTEVIVDENDEVITEEKRYLIVSSSLSLEECILLIHKYDGLAVASHVDRSAFSVISQLGFIPEDAEFDGIEIFSTLEGLPEKFPKICSSDAHYIGDIGKKYSSFECEKELEGRAFDILKDKLINRQIICHKGG